MATPSKRKPFWESDAVGELLGIAKTIKSGSRTMKKRVITRSERTTLEKLGKDECYAVAARLVIRHAADMTPKGRKQIAEWLREHAKMLIKDGPEYSSQFVGRYWYKEKQ